MSDRRPAKPDRGTFRIGDARELIWRHYDVEFIGPVGPPMWIAVRQPGYNLSLFDPSKCLPRDVCPPTAPDQYEMDLADEIEA